MISHQHKCIFVHIPRIAGSSIERWLCGADWWSIEPSTKHLLASQARVLYRDYWDEYFTFSFVRNPWDRVVSCLKYPNYFGIGFQRVGEPPAPRLDLRGYQARFGAETVLEHDHRFYKRGDLVSGRHLPGQVYGNILDEELDFIGRFENLAEDCAKIREILGIEEGMAVHSERSQRLPDYRKYYTRETFIRVGRLYDRDIRRFGYRF